MSRTPFYIDPSSAGWPTPNLIAGLIAAPTTEKLSPLERQATVVLAWLAHHSRAFARALVNGFFAGDEEALAALADADITIAARAWGTLRRIDGITGDMYPDLTLAGSGRSFEVIVEVKIDAELHWWNLPDGSRLYQTDAYIRSWIENYGASDEARVRRVGTLTRAGPGVELAPVRHRAADLTWSDVRGLLGQLLSDGALEREVVAVAVDTAASIDQRILIANEPPQIDDPVIAWGYTLLADLAPAIAERLPGGSLRLGAAAYADYAGAYVYFDSQYGVQRLWLYATPRKGKYNAPGCGSSLWIAETADGRWPAPLQALVRSAGIREVKDKASFKAYRLRLDVAEIQAAGDERAQLAHVLEAAAPLLEALRSAAAEPGATTASPIEKPPGVSASAEPPSF